MCLKELLIKGIEVSDVKKREIKDIKRDLFGKPDHPELYKLLNRVIKLERQVELLDDGILKIMKAIQA